MKVIISNPGPTDQEWMLTTFTRDSTSITFFDTEEEALAAQTAVLNMRVRSTTTCVSRIVSQGELKATVSEKQKATGKDKAK